MKTSVALLLTLALGAAAPVAGQVPPDSLPDGVTALMIRDGRMVFIGQGICSVCHGDQATGIENLGNDLTDDQWRHSDGSYEGILNTIVKGAWAESGTAMPHRNATTLDYQELRAVAAYVWSLSRVKAQPGN